MKTLTIFTSTYNRANTLPRTYESLCRQTCQDFEWLLIDDGSTDETSQLAEKWTKEGTICMRYAYKENGGLHTGYNRAIELANSKLCMCVDSDDWMPENGVEIIISFWEKHHRNDVGGIVGLCFTPDEKAIGGHFSPKLKATKFIDLPYKHHHHGDVKMVHRTELLKKLKPMPSFGNEKFFNPIYLFHQIDMNYPLLVLNKNLCYVEYQETGMTNNIFKQYENSPRSFSELRKLVMSRKDAPLSLRFRSAIHYVSSQIMLRNNKWLKESANPFLTLLASPFGVLLFFYIKTRKK